MEQRFGGPAAGYAAELRPLTEPHSSSMMYGGPVYITQEYHEASKRANAARIAGAADVWRLEDAVFRAGIGCWEHWRDQSLPCFIEARRALAAAEIEIRFKEW